MTAVIAVAAMGITFGATFAALKGTATDSPENTDPLAREVRPPNPRPTPVTANKPSNSTDAGAEADAGQATPGTAATPKPADAPKSRPRSPAKKGRKRASNATGSPKHGDAEQQPAVEGKESTSESPRQRTLEEALEGLRDE